MTDHHATDQARRAASASPFLTAEELAAVLRVSAWTVKHWARRVGPDALPSYRGGKKVLFDQDEALQWFRTTQRRQASVPVPVRRPRRQRRDAGRSRSEVERAT